MSKHKRNGKKNGQSSGSLRLRLKRSWGMVSITMSPSKQPHAKKEGVRRWRLTRAVLNLEEINPSFTLGQLEALAANGYDVPATKSVEAGLTS